MAAWIWVLIPLAAILVGGFKEWLSFREKQRRLGSSTTALEEELAALRETLDGIADEQQRLTTRVEHLETIVTSEAWDRSRAADANALDAPSPPLLDLEASPTDAPDPEAIASRMARALHSRS
ncbi:hypothetical protein [Salisaeta longa]|uniref:hypothetical protein n=1 Tax=Salisaeta longa TaxID=503170 RepID=UPI0003B63FF2|nr:hypothetical protein [Salisaeta longa]